MKQQSTEAFLYEANPTAKPFDIPGGPEGGLFVHGFTGTPAEMLPVAQMLHQQFGWHCSGPLLPGHGTNSQDIEKYKAKDWQKTTDSAWKKLSNKHKKIHLIGLSMGALLCLELFRKNPDSFASMVLLSPAVFLRTWPQRFLSSMARYPFLYLWVPPVNKETRDLPNHVAYSEYTAKASGEFARVYLQAQSLTPMKAPPTLLISSKTDEVVHPKSVSFLLERLQGPNIKSVVLEHSSHVITIGESKDQVMNEISSFYKNLK